MTTRTRENTPFRVTRDNPRVIVPPIVLDALDDKLRHTVNTSHDDRLVSGYEQLGERIGVCPKLLRRLALSDAPKVSSRMLDHLTLIFGLVGWVDVITGEETGVAA